MQDNSLLEAAQDVLESLATWRSTRRGGEAIPEELWAASVDLACRHGVYPTSRLLHLHYGDLKRRVHRRQAEATEAGSPVSATRPGPSARLAVTSRPASASTTFLEWLPTVTPSAIGSCIVQVESRHGASMRIDMHQVPSDALATIIRSFAQ